MSIEHTSTISLPQRGLNFPLQGIKNSKMRLQVTMQPANADLQVEDWSSVSSLKEMQGDKAQGPAFGGVSSSQKRYLPCARSRAHHGGHSRSAVSAVAWWKSCVLYCAALPVYCSNVLTLCAAWSPRISRSSASGCYTAWRRGRRARRRGNLH